LAMNPQVIRIHTICRLVEASRPKKQFGYGEKSHSAG